MKNNGRMFVDNKKVSFSSLRFSFVLNFEIANRDSMKKGINIPICFAKNIKPSARGEYEITDVNREYLKRGKLDVRILGRGSVWLDTGTFQSLMQANQYVQVIEQRQGRKIGCIEEIAYDQGFIDISQLESLIKKMKNNSYSMYLLNKLKKI